MTPLALRVMEKVRHRDHGTYEHWFQAIVDATLEEIGQREDTRSGDEIVALLHKPQRRAKK